MDKQKAKKLLNLYNVQVGFSLEFDTDQWFISFSDNSFMHFDAQKFSEKEVIKMAAMMHLAHTQKALNQIIEGLK